MFRLPILLRPSSSAWVRPLSSTVLFQKQCRRPLLLFTRRSLSSPSNNATNPLQSDEKIYHGPLTKTFRRLKIFSLSSLTLSFAMTPFIFVVEAALPLPARFALAATAMGTSGIATALVNWASKPYVSTLRRLDPAQNGGADGLEMVTLTLGLHKRVTRVYDTNFLVQTQRPFARWELAESMVVPAEEGKTPPAPGTEETVAETMDARGGVLGMWVVKWGEKGEGTCHEVGRIVRHFNVHEELLS